MQLSNAFKGVYRYGAGRLVRTTLINLGAGPIGAAPGPFTGADLFAVLYLIVFAIGIRELCRIGHVRAVVFVTTLFSTSLIVRYLTLGRASDWDWARYISHLLFPFLIVVSVGLQAIASRLRTPVLRGIGLAACVAVIVPGALRVQVREEYRQYREMAAYLDRQAEGLTGVIVLPYLHGLGPADERLMNIYFQLKGEGLPVYGVTDGDIHDVRLIPGHVGHFAAATRPLVPAVPSGRYALLARQPVSSCRDVGQWLRRLKTTGADVPADGAAAPLAICALTFEAE
jgi:hypothetical protein